MTFNVHHWFVAFAVFEDFPVTLKVK